MKRNNPFDNYSAETNYNTPKIKNFISNYSNHSSSKDSHLKEKDDFVGKSSDLGRSEIKSEDN